MENTDKNYIEETRNILLSVLKYCQKNDLILWLEGSHNFKFVIGDINSFETEREMRQYDPFESRYFSEIVEGTIYGTDFDIFPNSASNNSVIKPYATWLKNNPKEYNEFYLDFFWENGKEAANILSKSWLTNYLDLNHFINYKNENYPGGFYDKHIWNYSSGKNWRHFIDTIPIKRLNKFWEKHDNLKEFHSNVKNFNTHHAHGYLNYLTEKLIESKLSEDAMLKTSYMIMDIFPEEFQHYYEKKFPIVTSLIAKNRKDSLFPQTDNEIIERVIFPRYHVFEYFNNNNYTATQYSDLIYETLIKLKYNPDLEERGLISAEVTGADDITFYMILKDNATINKNVIKNLSLNIMESFINSPNAIIDIKANRLKDKCDLYLLEKISKTVVDNFVLDSDLPKKSIEDQPTKKIKKI